MTENTVTPKMEERWQKYLRRQRFGKSLILIGLAVTVISILMGVLPVAVAAFSEAPYVYTPCNDYFQIGVIFGSFLVLAGIISRISPNFIDGDGLWSMKTGPYR